MFAGLTTFPYISYVQLNFLQFSSSVRRIESVVMQILNALSDNCLAEAELMGIVVLQMLISSNISVRTSQMSEA